MKKFNKLPLLAGLAATASAITPIVAITSCNKQKAITFNITVDGATCDRTKSNIALDTDSTFALIPKTGYAIVDIDSVTVGDTELSETDYKFDSDVNVLTIYKHAMKTNKISIVVQNTLVSDIGWKDGWYAYETTGSGSIHSNEIDVTFETKEDLTSIVDSIYFVITTDSSKSTENRDIYKASGKANLASDTITISAAIKSTQESIMYIGDHIYYDITFIGIKNEETVLLNTVKNCYLYLLSNFNYKGFDLKETGYEGDANFWSSVNMKTSTFGTNVLASAEISNIQKDKDIPEDVTVELKDGVKATSERDLCQRIAFNKVDGLKTGQLITFDLTLYVWLADLPNQKVPFKAPGLKLVYTKK